MPGLDQATGSEVGFEYIENATELGTLAEYLAAHPTMALAVDTETTGLDPLEKGARLLLLQIGAPSGEIWVVNAAKLDLAPLRGILDNGRLCILQNAKFDYKWLKVHAGIRLRRVYDTMLAELILIAGLYDQVRERRGKASLKALVEKYVGRTMEKATRLTFVGHQGDEFTQEQLDYAADDLPHLWTIKDLQTVELKRGGLIETAKLEFGVVAAVGDMELQGISINAQGYRKVISESRMEMAKAEAACHAQVIAAGGYRDLFGDSHLNLASTDQVQAVFKNQFGLKLESTDEKALKRLGDHPFAAALLNFRDWETQVTSFGEKILAHLHPVTGRIHPEFQQMGGDAGRFTCEKPNMQQIPAVKKYRSMFIPRAGNVFVDADWQAMEMRILAKVSGDQLLLDAFLQNRDLHSHTAATMYGLDYGEVVAAHKSDAGSPERKRAKVLNFALCYGMGIPSMAEELKCSKEDAEEALERYFGAFPGVAAYLKRQDREGPRTLEVRTLGGRRRIFNAPRDRREIGSIQRKARNTPMQGTNGDAVKRAMTLLHQRLEDAAIAPGILLTIHDELLVECPKERADETVEIVRDSMNEAAAFYLEEVPAVTEVKVADFWLK
jgi:DNA polymerase-1